MIEFLIGAVLFFGMHSFSIFALPLRNSLAAKSEYGWKAIYGLISLVGLILLIRGYGQIRLEASVLYVPPIWLRHVASILLLPVFVLLVAPYFPGKINQIIKHPQLTAVKLWATAHLLVNGSSADLILFGSFLAWAVADRISVKRRPVREVPHRPPSSANTMIALILGIAMYAVFAIWLHEPLIGVRPF